MSQIIIEAIKRQLKAGTMILLLLLIVVFPMDVRANCRDEGCGCSGTWDPSWAGTAQESCTGTDCWYDPVSGTGCSGHHWYLYQHMEPEGCVQNGYTQYLCTNCAAVYRKVIHAPGHTFGEWSASDADSHIRTCQVCYVQETDHHEFTEWVTVSAGYRYRTCTDCGYTDEWIDRTAPVCTDYQVLPATWTNGTGSVAFTVTDDLSGIEQIELWRTETVQGSEKIIGIWSPEGSRIFNAEYQENQEGIFQYRLKLKDAAENESVALLGVMQLDHVAPMLSVKGNMDNWTNRSVLVAIDGEDYFPLTSIRASGVVSIRIADEDGCITAEGTGSAVLNLADEQEGTHTWTAIALDGAGNSTRTSFTTRYDHTKPVIEGSGMEITLSNGISGEYCSDNRIDQWISDPVCGNGCNGSGLMSVSLYKVKEGVKTRIRTDSTAVRIDEGNTGTGFQLEYDATDSDADYYLIAAQDHAGNLTTKTIITQKGILRSIHTSIDRSSYR